MYNYTTFINRTAAEQVVPCDFSKNRVLISINSPLWTPGTHEVDLDENAWAQILRLEFHDADSADTVFVGRDRRLERMDVSKIVLFDQSHAIEILKFLKEHQNKDYTDVIVHCEGGISRSAGVAKFIAMVYNLQFPEKYSLYNKKVFSTLLKTYGECMYGEGPLDINELPGYI